MVSEKEVSYLVIDLGNTHSKFATYKNNTQYSLQSFPNNDNEEIKEYLSGLQGVSRSIISSVVNISEDIFVFIIRKFNALIFDHSTKTPLTIKYKTPETLGRDRIAGALAAHLLFKGNNVLAIDAGTCIKYNFINSSSEFIGGAISPGISMRLKAMHTFTDLLPLVETTENVKLIGQSTEENLQSGAIMGAIAEVDRMIDLYRQSFHDLKVVVTGGDLKYFDNQLKNSIFARPNLVMSGLYEILLFNEI